MHRKCCGRHLLLATLGLLLPMFHSMPETEASEWAVPDSTIEDVMQVKENGMPVLVLIYRGSGNPVEQRTSQYALPMWDMVAQKLLGSHQQGTAPISAGARKKFMERGRTTRDLGKLMIRKVRVDPWTQQKVVDTTEVDRIPEVILMRGDGGDVHYKGQLRTQLIVNWVNWLLNRTHPLTSKADLDTFLHDSGLAVVGLFDSEKTDEAVAFYDAARHPSILKRNVAMAAAHSEQLSNQLAERLKYHMRLHCVTVTVGPSSSQKTALPLKARRSESWECNSALVDPRGLAYGEEAGPQFSASVVGGSLVVSRTDADAHKGWIRHLHLKCCTMQSEDNGVDEVLVPLVAILTPAGSSLFGGAPTDAESLRLWIHEEAAHYDGTIAIELDDANYDAVFDPECTNLPVLLVVPAHGKSGEACRSALDEAVPDLKDRVISAVLRPGPALEPLVEQWGLPTVQADEDLQSGEREADVEAGHDIWSIRTGAYLLDQTDGLVRNKYWLEGEVTKESILRFVEDYERGELQVLIRTEPAPSADDRFTGSVRNLVGSSFKEVTQNPALDVLVIFYAPWCGHCQQFKLVYMQLAAKLRHVSTLEFAHMDGTRNEAAGLQIRSYPSAVLFPAGARKNEIAEFRGVRSLETLRSWLHEHCTHDFEDMAAEVNATSLESDSLLGPDDDGPSFDL